MPKISKISLGKENIGHLSP